MHQNAVICIRMRMLKNNTTFVKKQHLSLRQRHDECPLCKAQGPHEGEHVLRCAGIPTEHRDAAAAQMVAALVAAADSLPSGDRRAPAENTLLAWREAAHRAGQHGAAEALGLPPTDEGTRAPRPGIDVRCQRGIYAPLDAIPGMRDQAAPSPSPL